MPAASGYELAALRRYERLLEEACLEEDVPFLPLLEPLLGDPHWLRLIDGDGVHLNGAGHQRIFERVRQWPALLRWAGLEPLVACTPSA